MKTLIHLIVAGHGLVLVASASANPIMSEVARIREVPGPHVQLTYAVDRKSPQTPSIPDIFGSKSTPWKAAAYSANTGSGVRSLNAVQMCDCYVPLGQSLVYKVTVPNSYDGKSLDYSLAVVTSGQYDAGAVENPPVIDAGVMPWTIPDPVEIQGIDCTSECAAIRPPVDAAAGALDAEVLGTGGAGGATGTACAGGATGEAGATGTGGSSVDSTTLDKSAKSDGCGCSMAQGNGLPDVFVLALLGLALLAARKRRA